MIQHIARFFYTNEITFNIATLISANCNIKDKYLSFILLIRTRVISMPFRNYYRFKEGCLIMKWSKH
jgi:hypothetical protein